MYIGTKHGQKCSYSDIGYGVRPGIKEICCPFEFESDDKSPH